MNENNNNASQSISIEDGFKNLDMIVRNMESGNQSLEDAFKDYQKGIALIQDLDKALTNMEKRLEVFNKMTGELETQDE